MLTSDFEDIWNIIIWNNVKNLIRNVSLNRKYHPKFNLFPTNKDEEKVSGKYSEKPAFHVNKLTP